VLLSVIAHGATANPLATWYAKLAAHPAGGTGDAQMPDMPEGPAHPASRQSRLISADSPGGGEESPARQGQDQQVLDTNIYRGSPWLI
jgi:hypothetical protein